MDTQRDTRRQANRQTGKEKANWGGIRGGALGNKGLSDEVDVLI